RGRPAAGARMSVRTYGPGRARRRRQQVWSRAAARGRGAAVSVRSTSVRARPKGLEPAGGLERLEVPGPVPDPQDALRDPDQPHRVPRLAERGEELLLEIDVADRRHARHGTAIEEIDARGLALGSGADHAVRLAGERVEDRPERRRRQAVRLDRDDAVAGGA